MKNVTRISKGQLDDSEMHYLNIIHADLLGNLFEKKVTPFTAYPKNSTVPVYRPAYNDFISISSNELQMCVQAVAYSTLSQMAHEYIKRDGNWNSLYLLGFNDAKIKYSGENYRKTLESASSNVFRVLD